jgi:uncharacterized membrane protein
MKYKSLLVLFFLALISSVLISIPAINGSCTQNTCGEVQKSEYSKFLGIKDSYYGIIIFSVLVLLTISNIRNPHKYKKHIIHSGIIVGALIATYFLYLQKFVIGEYCKFCLIVDISLLIAFGIAIFTWKK